MYIYRFINKENEVIYVGKATNYKTRIRGHGHLPLECYKGIDKIEYANCKNSVDYSIYEIYYINKYKPLYNTEFKRKDENGEINLNDLEWVGTDIRPSNPNKDNKTYSYNTVENRHSFEIPMNKLNEYDIKIGNIFQLQALSLSHMYYSKKLNIFLDLFLNKFKNTIKVKLELLNDMYIHDSYELDEYVIYQGVVLEKHYEFKYNKKRLCQNIGIENIIYFDLMNPLNMKIYIGSYMQDYLEISLDSRFLEDMLRYIWSSPYNTRIDISKTDVNVATYNSMHDYALGEYTKSAISKIKESL